jgi:hypothetical protein
MLILEVLLQSFVAICSAVLVIYRDSISSSERFTSVQFIVL